MEAWRAVALLATCFRETPLMFSSWLSEEAGIPVYVKLESEQITGSFKARWERYYRWLRECSHRMDRYSWPPTTCPTLCAATPGPPAKLPLLLHAEARATGCSRARRSARGSSLRPRAIMPWPSCTPTPSCPRPTRRRSRLSSLVRTYIVAFTIKVQFLCALAEAAPVHDTIFPAEAAHAVPDTISPAKAERLRRLGAELVKEGASSLEAEEKAMEYAREHGMEYMSPYNDPRGG